MEITNEGKSLYNLKFNKQEMKIVCVTNIAHQVV